jgi:hypothetical protein
VLCVTVCISQRNPPIQTAFFLSSLILICSFSKQDRHLKFDCHWATGWTIGVLEFDSRRELGIFLFTTASRTALGPTQSPNQLVKGALSLGVNRSEREADHSPPSSAEIKECVELYLQSPNTPSWCCAQLNHRDNFTLLYLTFILIKTYFWAHVHVSFPTKLKPLNNTTKSVRL